MPKTRIFAVVTEHAEYGQSYSEFRIQARTAAEALRKALPKCESRERPMGVQLVAETD